MILVDSREPAGIISCLPISTATVVTLPTGDYLFFTHDGKKVLIERKTPSDLLHSFQSGRLQDQVRRLIEEADIPFILLEGHFAATKEGFVKIDGQTLQWHFVAIQNMLATIQLSGAYLIFSDDNASSVMVVIALHNYFQKKESHTSLFRSKMLKLSTDDIMTTREMVVASVPGFGAELAKRLIERFGSPIDVFLADEDKLKEVAGIGDARIKKMIEVIFPSPSEDEKEKG